VEKGTIICSKSVNTTQIVDATQEDEEKAATRRCYIIGTDSSQDDAGTWKDAVRAAKQVIKIMQKSGIQRTVITTIHGSSEQKKEGAGEKLRSELGRKIENVKVNSPRSGRAFIHVKDIDELSTEKEIIEALQKALNLKNYTELKIISIRLAFGWTQAATVMAPGDVAARMLQLGHVRIGLVQCRLRERVDVKKCYRCWMPGHLRKECQGPERKGLCTKCGEEGHQSKDCQGKAYCTVCSIGQSVPKVQKRDAAGSAQSG
jgi:hypothetical protein